MFLTYLQVAKWKVCFSAVSEGAINAAVLQGGNANGTGDLYTNVDENDNAVLDGNADVATKSNGTSEVINVAVGNVTDKDGNNYGKLRVLSHIYISVFHFVIVDLNFGRWKLSKIISLKKFDIT